MRIKMKLLQVVGLLVAFGAGYVSATLLSHEGGDLPSTASVAAVTVQKESVSEDRVAQQDFGSRCSTLQGICSLPQPQPIGSVCYCSGDVRGSTIR
jgi:hypothetical protein